MTWHQWHALYPTLRKIGLFSCFAFANASSPHAYHWTGFCACCKRYGLDSFIRLFGNTSYKKITVFVLISLTETIMLHALRENLRNEICTGVYNFGNLCAVYDRLCRPSICTADMSAKYYLCAPRRHAKVQHFVQRH